jgi:hypothetical protein
MVGLSSGLTSIGTANFASPFTSNSQSPKGSASTFGANFSDLLVSTSSGQGSGATASAQSVAAAASAAAIDVDGLQKFSKAFGSNPNHYRIGMQTIGSDGRVIAGASLDGDGDLSVYGSGSSGDTSSSLDMPFRRERW